MKRHALLTLMFLPGLAHAVICKTTDADGVVSYSDVSTAECPQPLKLPDYSRYAPRPVEQSPTAPSSATATQVRFERYQSMSIIQPEQNGTVRSNEGSVAVSIALQPPLQQGHVVKIFLDGRAVSGDFDGPAIELGGVERGTHSLRASVVDTSGKRLIEAETVRFTLRKLGLNDVANQPKPEPPIEKPPYAPPGAPDYGAGKAPDYNAPAQGGDYAPKSAPISSTPGKTNPAFAPKFTP